MTNLTPFVEAGGLTIVTGRPGAGRSAAVEQVAGAAARAGRPVLVVREKTAGDWDGVSRYSAPIQASAALDDVLTSANSIVVIDEVFDSERAAFATRAATPGNAVLAIVSAGDVLEALDWFTELATRDEATEFGVYTALTAVVRVGDEPDMFVNTPEATRALIEGRPSGVVRATGGPSPRTTAA